MAARKLQNHLTGFRDYLCREVLLRGRLRWCSGAALSLPACAGAGVSQRDSFSTFVVLILILVRIQQLVRSATVAGGTLLLVLDQLVVGWILTQTAALLARICLDKLL